MKEQPIIIFIADIMLGTRIESAAAAQDFDTITVPSPRYFTFRDTRWIPNQPGEPTVGPNAELVNWLTLIQPALLIFDLSNNQIPWQEWLPIIKSSPATRNIPAICFGPHVDVARLESAEKLGVELSVPRSRFFSNLSALIKDYTRGYPKKEISNSCSQPLSTTAQKGVEEFNKGNYFLAHEYLEDAWNEEPGIGRELYQGILQVAVAYLQIERKNYRGAVKMFMRSRQWLTPLPDSCRDIDIAQLKADSEGTYREILSLGLENLDKFDKARIKPIILRSSESPGGA